MYKKRIYKTVEYKYIFRLDYNWTRSYNENRGMTISWNLSGTIQIKKLSQGVNFNIVIPIWNGLK